MTGPNGNRIFLVAAGGKRNGEITRDYRSQSSYWTSTQAGSSWAVAMHMTEKEEASNISDGVDLFEGYEDILDSYQIRLVHSPIPSQQD